MGLELTGLEATSAAGETLRVVGKAKLGKKPVDVHLEAEPLADLLKRPKGPWRDLAMSFEAGDIGFEATGSSVGSVCEPKEHVL